MKLTKKQAKKIAKLGDTWEAAMARCIILAANEPKPKPVKIIKTEFGDVEIY